MFILHKTRRCNEARFLLASPQTSFGIPDERTPKNVCRVKKNSDDDSRTGRRLWWSLLHWWSKTLLFSWVLYSSRRSHSNFVVLKSYGGLIYFCTWKEFPPWNFNRLRRSRNWKWLELFYLSLLCLFVCLFLPQEPEKCSVLSAFS